MNPSLARPSALLTAALCLALGAGFARGADAPAAPTPTPVVTNDSRTWIAAYGDNIWAQYHPDWQGWFPGGHSNRFHQMYVQNVWDHHPITTDWKEFNRAWLFDGEWFAVEWFYTAKFTDDGFMQWEGTLGIGHLKDGKLISWTEFFDDQIGNLQHLRMMPLYDIKEPVFPWPARSYLRMPYRP